MTVAYKIHPDNPIVTEFIRRAKAERVATVLAAKAMGMKVPEPEVQYHEC